MVCSKYGPFKNRCNDNTFFMSTVISCHFFCFGVFFVGSCFRLVTNILFPSALSSNYCNLFPVDVLFFGVDFFLPLRKYELA
jgi:hypothetical protein